MTPIVPLTNPKPNPRDLETVVAGFLAGRWFLPGLGLSVVVMLALATVPIPSSRVAMEVHTRSLTVQAGHVWATVPVMTAGGAPGAPLVPGTQVRLIGRFPILPQAVAPPQSAADDPEGTLEVKPDAGELTQVSFDPRAFLTIATLPGDAVAYVTESGVGMTFSLTGSVSAAPAPAHAPTRIETPGTIVVAAAPDQPLHATLHLAYERAQAADVGIDDLPIINLGFSQQRLSDDDRSPFRSDVLGGSIRLLDVGREVRLRPGDLIWLGCPTLAPLLRWTGVAALLRWSRGEECFTANLTRSRLADGVLTVEAVGRAAHVGLGPQNATDDLTPSVLDYLVGQHSIKLLWGAAVVIFGFLWRARVWARNQQKNSHRG